MKHPTNPVYPYQLGDKDIRYPNHQNCHIRISMDGRGRWSDNVHIKRLWRTVKYEDIYLQGYEEIGSVNDHLIWCPLVVLIFGRSIFLSNFALAPLNIQSLNEATTILSATSSNPIDLLKKQLMASEFNYVSGAYIGGNQMVTYFFVYDGEYMLNNSGSFTSTQLLAQKDV